MNFFRLFNKKPQETTYTPDLPPVALFDIPLEVRHKVELTEFEERLMELVGDKGLYNFFPVASYRMYGSTAIYREVIFGIASWDNKTQEIVLPIMVEAIKNARMTEQALQYEVDRRMIYLRDIIRNNRICCETLKMLMPILT